jgi:hypothetical protein
MPLINEVTNTNLDVAVPSSSRTVLVRALTAGIWGDRASELLCCRCQGGRYSGGSRQFNTPEAQPQPATEV